jgi:hypothetical protein
MLALISALACLGSPSPAKIAPLEAVAAAQWFCRSVDVRPPYDLLSVDLRRGPGYIGTQIYTVLLKRPGGRGPMSVQVDAGSGDVVYARDGELMKQAASQPRSSVMPPPSPVTGSWVKRLGRANELVHGSPGDRYDVAIGGRPFFNLNGSTMAHFGVRDGAFVSYDGFGAVPPGPNGKPTVSESRAIKAAIAQRKKTVPNWPEPLEPRTELGLFYNERTRTTTWAWKVIEGRVIQGKFYDSFTNYVDGRDGKIIADGDIQGLRFMYRSRAPRKGLAKVKPLSIEIPFVSLAEKRLKEIGRADVRFDSIKIDQGIHMSSEAGTDVVVGPTGDLQSFKAAGVPGKPKAEAALAKGRAIIFAQHPKLPEGKVMVVDGPYSFGQQVVYRQSAFGYDYLNGDVVTVRFGGKCDVVLFGIAPPSPKPEGLPKTILTRDEIQKKALALAKPYLQKNTDRVTYFAEAKAGKLGWYVQPTTRRVRLSYEVYVGFNRDIKNWALQGGGSTYHFDAETGQCLQNFPGWAKSR